MDVLKIAEEIKADKKPRQIMPWQLFNALNCCCTYGNWSDSNKANLLYINR